MAEVEPRGVPVKASAQFQEYFGADRLADLDEDDAIIYGLDDQLRLQLLNNAWFRFARHNNAPLDFNKRFTLGASYADALPDTVRDFFVDHIREAIAAHKPWAFDYQCPSPSLYRDFRMQVLPMADQRGCLVSNALIVEMPHPDEPTALADMRASYFDPSDMIVQCCNCRRTQRVDRPNRWDWVPELVKNLPPRTSHGLCPACSGSFYPAAIF